MLHLGAIQHSEVAIPTAGVTLPGDLKVPTNATGLVVFAHGSGSSRFSPRNRFVASELHRVGLATLLFDLLTADEQRVDERTGRLRFDIGLLAERLTGAVDWLARQPGPAGLAIGLFGASTGAAAALITASHRADLIGAVVSRGGRPDLAAHALSAVKAPTLMIVGELDVRVIQVNRQAAELLECEHAMAIVPGATHLFEEPGTLDEVARLAGEWFKQHLGRTKAAT